MNQAVQDHRQLHCRCPGLSYHRLGLNDGPLGLGGISNDEIESRPGFYRNRCELPALDRRGPVDGCESRDIQGRGVACDARCEDRRCPEFLCQLHFARDSLTCDKLMRKGELGEIRYEVRGRLLVLYHPVGERHACLSHRPFRLLTTGL